MTLIDEEHADPRPARSHPARDAWSVGIRADELPVFWACGVTPQAVASGSRPELMITHAPGHMFVTDEEGARQTVA
jgi:uncharacterized protein YcsI (UPF0317 family)